MTEKSSLVSALVKAQGAMGGAKKDSENPHFRSRYADLESVTAAIKPAASENGLAFIQSFSECENGVAVETIILHESGEQLSNGILRVPASKQDAQGYGSAITYARRYSLMAAFGLAPEDDDGNAASGDEQVSKSPKPKVKPFAPTITEAQKGELIDLVADTNTDIEKFLGYYKAKSFEDFPTDKFQPAIAALKKKVAA